MPMAQAFGPEYRVRNVKNAEKVEVRRASEFLRRDVIIIMGITLHQARDFY